MLVVANFANTKWYKNPKEWLETWHMATPESTQQELSNEYQ